MKIEYDKEVDALYIRIQEKYVARTEEVAEAVGPTLTRTVDSPVWRSLTLQVLLSSNSTYPPKSVIGQAINRRPAISADHYFITPLIGSG